jgi:hypothetical protein
MKREAYIVKRFEFHVPSFMFDIGVSVIRSEQLETWN